LDCYIIALGISISIIATTAGKLSLPTIQMLQNEFKQGLMNA